jgi:hypothetical protein
MSGSKKINCMVVRCTTIEREGDEGENGDVKDDSGEGGMNGERTFKENVRNMTKSPSKPTMGSEPSPTSSRLWAAASQKGLQPAWGDAYLRVG